MAQALCWLVARLARLACVVASGSENVLLLYGGPAPKWMKPWLIRLLRWSGWLKRGENPVTLLGLSMVERVAVGMSGALRVEFTPGAFTRFKGLVLREAVDFALLKARASQRGA